MPSRFDLIFDCEYAALERDSAQIAEWVGDYSSAVADRIVNMLAATDDEQIAIAARALCKLVREALEALAGERANKIADGLAEEEARAAALGIYPTRGARYTESEYRQLCDAAIERLRRAKETSHDRC